MPKNKGKGGKTRKRGKNSGTDELIKRDLIIKDVGQEYAVVQRMLGNGRVEAYCYDGKKRQCHIRGKMKKKKIWINQGDTVLISLRDYQDEKADIIHRYKPEEARELKKIAELPDDAKINENDTSDTTTTGIKIEFEESTTTTKTTTLNINKDKKESSSEDEEDDDEEEEEDKNPNHKKKLEQESSSEEEEDEDDEDKKNKKEDGEVCESKEDHQEKDRYFR